MNNKEFYFSHEVADWCSVADLLVLLYRKRRAIKMGRDATKAAGNPWFEARKKASEYDDRLRSREGAAELLGMSVSSVADAELDLSKCMPVDKAVLMADLYKAPHLLNYYCLNECPIGHRHCISDEVVDIERATLKLLKILDEHKLNEVKRKLIEVAEDGVVCEKDAPHLQEALEYLKELSKIVSELKIIGDMVLGGNDEKQQR